MSDYSSQPKSVSDLSINHVVIEDRGNSKAKKFALAAALALSMSDGALAMNAPDASAPVAQYSAADFAKESIDKKLAAKQEAELAAQKAKDEAKNKEPEKNRLDTAVDAIKESQGYGEKTSKMAKVGNFIGTVLLIGDSQTALVKTGAEVLIAGSVGAGSKNAEKGVTAAGYLSDAAVVFGTGGYAAVPVLYRYGKDGLDAYKEAEQKRIERNLAEVKDRTQYVAEVYTYSMRLEDREKRMADTPENQATYNKRMLEDAKLKVENGGYATQSLNNAIELEEMVKKRGGEVEPWYDEYLKYKSEYKPKEPDVQDFFGKAIDLKSSDTGLASSTDFLRNLTVVQDQKISLQIG